MGALLRPSHGRGLIASPWEAGLLVLLIVWGVAPLAVMIAHAAASGQVFTGGDGPFVGDQLQYLSWVRDEGSHLLAANDFTIGARHADFIQPMFLISGGLWRLGAGFTVAYQVWKPVAIVVLFAGVASYVRRTVQGTTARAVAIALALFFSAPVAALASWAHLGAVVFQRDLNSIAGEMSAADNLWGYLPTAIAIGLMPVFLLGVERLLMEPPEAGGQTLAWTSAAGALVSWLHPWQGETLVLMVVGLCIWRAHRPCARLAIPVALTAAPLIYYLLLSRYDPSWKTAELQDVAPRASILVLLLDLAPTGLIALAGVRRRPSNVQERLLLLWVPAALLAYLISPSGGAHALNGISIPLAVLAVRGWERVQIRWSPAVAAACVAVATIPGLAMTARTERNLATDRIQPVYLNPGDADALRALASDRTAGGVLSTAYLGSAVPAYTGRQVWAGHPVWTTGWKRRSSLAGAIFTGALRGAAARQVIAGSGARFLLADCHRSLDLAQTVGGELLSARHYGCATVYTVASGSLRSGSPTAETTAPAPAR